MQVWKVASSCTPQNQDVFPSQSRFPCSWLTQILHQSFPITYWLVFLCGQPFKNPEPVFCCQSYYNSACIYHLSFQTQTQYHDDTILSLKRVSSPFKTVFCSLWSLAFLAASRLLLTWILCPGQSSSSVKHFSLQHFLHNLNSHFKPAGFGQDRQMGIFSWLLNLSLGFLSNFFCFLFDIGCCWSSAGLATNSILFFFFLFVKNHWFAWRAN